MNEKISMIREEVHQELNMERYKSTEVRDYTNCYAYAIGSTLGLNELYRVGAICERKNIEEKYFSIQELKQLLEDDMKVLNLKIEEIPNENVELDENQYVIKLFVKIYRKEAGIFDFHFARMDREKTWTEKWWRQAVTVVSKKGIECYNNFPWKYVATYRITR